MITKTITVEIPAGLEVRPVAVLVQVANQYSSSIYVESGNKKAVSYTHLNIVWSRWNVRLVWTYQTTQTNKEQNILI